MTREQLFKKYSIDESHNAWDDSIDSWNSVEIYRLMHKGELPKEGDMSVKYITDFLDMPHNNMAWWSDNVMCRKDRGSLFLTAKRMVYRFNEKLIAQ
jgi:hypothetical protein